MDAERITRPLILSIIFQQLWSNGNRNHWLRNNFFKKELTTMLIWLAPCRNRDWAEPQRRDETTLFFSSYTTRNKERDQLKKRLAHEWDAKEERKKKRKLIGCAPHLKQHRFWPSLQAPSVKHTLITYDIIPEWWIIHYHYLCFSIFSKERITYQRHSICMLLPEWRRNCSASRNTSKEKIIYNSWLKRLYNVF